jgi:hypothetical protein
MRTKSTGLLGQPVEGLGNLGRLSALSCQISKLPEFHNLDLENPPAYQTTQGQSLRRDFHFSSLNDYYYCLLFL